VKGRPNKQQIMDITKAITNKMPDQLKLPLALWTKEAVQQLICKKFHINVSIITVGRYLQQWGFSPQKPIYKAYEQNSLEVKECLEHKYPSIKAQALREKAEIHCSDELVNQDIKTNVVGKQRTLNVEQMENNVKRFMTKRMNDPEQVIKYLHAKLVQYAE
jgi:hypothetical protein